MKRTIYLIISAVFLAGYLIISGCTIPTNTKNNSSSKHNNNNNNNDDNDNNLGEYHWELLDGSLENNPSIITWPQITVKGTTPYACWVENGQLYVKHFDGSSWVQDGGNLIVNSGGNAAYPVIISDNTSVYVNWREDYNGGLYFYVKKLTASGWEVVGNNYIIADAATEIIRLWDTSSIAISNNGTLYFTLIRDSMGNRSFYFDGSTWQTIWTSDLPWYYMYPIYPQLVFNNNILYIIWEDTLSPDGGDAYIDVAYFDNNTQNYVRPWDPLCYTNRAYKPRMAASSDSILYATWNESDGSKSNIYVKKLSGSAWTLVGSAGLNVDPANSAYNQDITCAGTTPYVVWEEIDPDSNYSSIYVKHFNDTEWVQDGSALNVSATSSYPRIASDGNTPYVIWKEYDQGSYSHVYVKRWVK